MQKTHIRKLGAFAATALALALCFAPRAADFPDLEGRPLIPLGHTTGIKLYSDGALVVSLSEGASPAKEAGLEAGDLITAVNGSPIDGNEALQQALKGQGGCRVELTVIRDGKELRCSLVPRSDSAGTVRIGAWVRDSMAGIGTITFVDPQSGSFGALGHGICDPDTGELMPFSLGTTMRSSVASVTRGKVGEPGTLNGSYDLEKDSGTILQNTEGGIFGVLSDTGVYKAAQAVPVGDKEDLKPGKAHILSNVAGDAVERYEVEILKVYDKEDGLRDMMIKVTDSRLLERTGGIVQGMSGSPIIQNGKLVGAVTHVLVNDPARGYGIAIENMLEMAA